MVAFNSLNAQSYFTSSFGLPGQNHVGRKMYHVNDTLNIIIGFHQLQNGDPKGILYQLDSSYNLVSSTTYNDSNLRGGFENVYPISDTTFIITSTTSTDTVPTKFSLTILCLNHEIDTLWTITISDSLNGISGNILHFENNILYLICNIFNMNTTMDREMVLIAIDLNSKQIMFNKTYSISPHVETGIGSYIYHEHRNSFFLTVYNIEDTISLLRVPYILEINKLGDILNKWQLQDTMELYVSSTAGLIYNNLTKELNIFYEDLTTTNYIRDGFVICVLDSNLQIKNSNKYYNNWLHVSKATLNSVNSTIIFLAGGNIFIVDSTGYMLSNNNYYSSTFPLLQINNQSATAINNDLFIVGLTQYTLSGKQEMLISKCDFSGVGCYINPVPFSSTPYLFQMTPSINAITVDSSIIIYKQPHFNIQSIVLNRFDQCIPNAVLEDINKQEEVINVFPNPFHSSIQFKNLPSSIQQVQVFSLEGKTILTFNYSIDNDQIINFGFLVPGVYLLKLNLSNGSNTYLKIVKS